MGDIKLADFGTGMDTRRSASTSNPKSFRDIENCHITTGRTLKKRGGFRHVASLPEASAGLMAHNGALHTFKTARGLLLSGNPESPEIITPSSSNVATMIAGETVQIVVDEIERIHTTGIAKTINGESIYGFDVRRIHFAESFSAYPYIIVEHWNGSISHHYLNHGTLSDRVPEWNLYVGADNNWIKPTTYPTEPFIFKVYGVADGLITEPFWGLKNWADREATERNLIQAESAAALAEATAPAVADPYLNPLYLAFHDGGAFPAAPLPVIQTFIGLDNIWLPNNTITPLAKDNALDANGILQPFAENEVAQANYLTTVRKMLREFELLSNIAKTSGGIIKKEIARLQDNLNKATIAAKAAKDAWGSRNSSDHDWRGKSKRNAAARVRSARLARDAAQAALTLYTAQTHADGNVDNNLDAAVALCKWKMDNYISLLAAGLALHAPIPVLGDYAWANPIFTEAPITFITTRNPLSVAAGDVYAIASDAEGTLYTQIKDHDLNQDSTVAVNIAEKLFVADLDAVRFSQTNDPTRWIFDAEDNNLDTGWLPVGNHQSGTRKVTGLGQHLGKMVVFFDDASQLWTVDPNPESMAFNQTVEGVGSIFPHSISNISNDTIFLHRTGFRSISTMQYNNNQTDNDFGSPVDNPVVTHLANADLRQDVAIFATATPTIDLATVNKVRVVAKAFGVLGQYWCAIGADIWVFTYSRSAGIAGWSRYTLPYEVDDMAELHGVVYIRAGNRVYAYDEALNVDEIDSTLQSTAPVEGSALFQYLTAKSAGRLKMFHSFDSIILGNASLRFKFDVRNPDIETAAVPLTGDSNPDYLTPMQLSSTHISPVITSLEPFELEYLALYFNMLGRR